MFPLKDDNPTLHPPVLTIALIALNVLVFLWQLAGDAELKVLRHAAIPYNLTQSPREVAYLPLRDVRGAVVDLRPVSVTRGSGERDGDLVRSALPPWATLFAAMFMHGGWLHLLGNMLFLWIFGNNIEDALGRPRFVGFYLVTGLAASLAHVLSDPTSTVPMLGASGAVSGILGGYLVLYPRAQVLALIPLGFVLVTQRLPAIAFLGIWFLMQILNLFGAAGGVAWYAHVGGFVVGMALVKLLETREHRARAIPALLRRPPVRPRDPWSR